MVTLLESSAGDKTLYKFILFTSSVHPKILKFSTCSVDNLGGNLYVAYDSTVVNMLVPDAPSIHNHSIIQDEIEKTFVDMNVITFGEGSTRDSFDFSLSCDDSTELPKAFDEWRNAHHIRV